MQTAKEFFRERSKGGSAKDLKAILVKIPDKEPADEDRL
jgi:hypothetical protein